MSFNTGLKFRDFVTGLQKNHDLIEITEQVDPNLEVGAILRKCYEEKAAAPLITNLKQEDSKQDSPFSNFFKILGCPGGLTKNTTNDHSRLALHVGLPSETSMKDIIQFLVDTKKKPLIKPSVISAAKSPCKENHLSGDQIDLEALPVPLLHPGDGGKYIQTFGMWCLQTPDGSWTNWSIARGMVNGKRTITGLVMNPQHIRQVADKWGQIGKGREIPFCLCFGVPPAAILVSSMPIPDGATEAEYIGALLGEGVPVVKAETNDLLVPATSEMVFEGTLDIETMSTEGPFGEMHGYCFADGAIKCPTYTVNHLSYRTDPILPVSNPGLCVDETHTFIGSLVSTEILSILQDAKLPVLEAFSPYESQALWLAVKVDTKQLRRLKTTPEKFCRSIGDLLFPLKPASIFHEIIVFGDDIDIFSFRDVIWGYSTRHAPGKDQYYYPDVHPFPLAPFVSHSELIKTKQGGKVVTNCILERQYTEEIGEYRCDYDSYSTKVKDRVEGIWARCGGVSDN